MSDTQARVNHYSQAILQTVIERWQTALTQVTDAVASNAAVNVLLVDAGKDAASKIAGLEKVLPAGLPAEVTNFIKLLVQEGDFALLPQVSASLSHSVSGRSGGPLKADITSAVDLTPDEQANLRRMLSEQHGDGLVFSFRVDPSLMGGLRVRVGDSLIDTSVASRLAKLRESLAAVVR